MLDGSMRRSARLAATLATLLVASGVAAAVRPVFCPMTGTVAAGRCCCDTGSPDAAVLPDCCTRTEVASAPSVSEPALALAAPVPTYVATLVAPAADPAWQAPAPDVASTSPPLPLLHRALLI
jgi:hypothetical protein